MTGVSAGQVDDVPPQTNGRGRSGYMGYRVEHGDTAYYDSIDPAWIFPKGYRGTKRDLKRSRIMLTRKGAVLPGIRPTGFPPSPGWKRGWSVMVWWWVLTIMGGC